MWLFKILKKLDRKFALGFIIALLMALYMVYDIFIADKYPQIYFDVFTNTAVLDIKEDLPKLKILFEGLNIKEQNLSLRIVSVKVVNDSSQHIRKIDYDTEDPIGFRVQPGEIIRTNLTDTSNDYLAKNLTFSYPTNNVVHFKDIIFDAHQFFVIKLLVLHPANQIPTVSPIGHIAGMKKILVRESYKDFGRVSFWAKALSGSLGIQLFRMVVYFLGSILLFLVLVIPPSLIDDKLHKRKQKRVVKEFKESGQLNESDEYIFKTYMTKGVWVLLSMQYLAASQETLNKALSAYREWQKIPQEIRTEAEYGLYAPDVIRDTFSYEVYKTEDLISAGFIKISGESGAVDPHMKDTLDRFVLFLKNKGMISIKDSARITITGVGTFTATGQPGQAVPTGPDGGVARESQGT
ncbi:MAG: hypothetical protein ACLQGU_04460 [bacterium]